MGIGHVINGPSDLFRRTDWEFIRISFSYLHRQQNSSHRVNKTKSKSKWLLDLNCKLFKIFSPFIPSKSPKSHFHSLLIILPDQMANIEVSLCNSVPRRRKSGCGGGGSGSVVSGGGGGSVKSTPIAARCETSSPAKEIRSALQDREAVIQNLRVQLGLGKLPRPSGTPLDESERPAAEQKLHRLKVDAENKRIAIRNLKMALDKLDITE